MLIFVFEDYDKVFIVMVFGIFGLFGWILRGCYYVEELVFCEVFWEGIFVLRVFVKNKKNNIMIMYRVN